MSAKRSVCVKHPSKGKEAVRGNNVQLRWALAVATGSWTALCGRGKGEGDAEPSLDSEPSTEARPALGLMLFCELLRSDNISDRNVPLPAALLGRAATNPPPLA